MNNLFFEHPVINSPYQYPARHWELDDQGQPTQKILETRRSAKFITPIPKPRKRKQKDTYQQMQQRVKSEGRRVKKMKKKDLLAEVASGEDSTRQFKADVRNIDSLASEIAAFANSDGGTIFIGVADDGAILGLLSCATCTKFRPGGVSMHRDCPRFRNRFLRNFWSTP